jgi:septal ring factor EnvC (AmiA/AmiB activator)
VEHARSVQVFIVARRHPELFDYLSERFADDPNVTVVLDRRLAPRRRRALPAAAERRRVDRRTRPEVEAQLRATSLAIATQPTVAATADPASEARQWVEGMQRGVQAVRSALDDHERLRHETRAIKREHERLRAEIDRAGKELAELDASISRAIELVTDLRSRLNKEPGEHPSR